MYILLYWYQVTYRHQYPAGYKTRDKTEWPIYKISMNRIEAIDFLTIQCYFYGMVLALDADEC